MSTIGLSITICRNNRRWTQERLAAALGIRQSRLSQIENDQVSPKWSQIEEIARLLEVELTELLPLSAPVITGQEWRERWLQAQEELLRTKDELIRVLQRSAVSQP